MPHQIFFLWENPSLCCPLNFSSQFLTNTKIRSYFKMTSKFSKRKKTSKLSVKKQLCSSHNRSLPKAIARRGAGVGLAALATVGLLGGRLAVGRADECGLRCVFGPRQDQSKANAKYIRRLPDYQVSSTAYVTLFTTNTDEKFFLVENELDSSNAIQAEMAVTVKRS